MNPRMYRMAVASIAIAAMAVFSTGCNDERSADHGEASSDRTQAAQPRLIDPPDPQPELADALFDAVMADNEERAIELVQEGAPPNATNAQGVPVLFIAAGGCIECEGALVELTRVLLEYGADATVTIARGTQAIHWVGRAGAGDRPGTHETLDLLIEYGADINVPTDDGLRAIDFAVRIGNEEWVEYLISRGARLN